jgi:CHAT domain-containing protein
MNDPQRAKRTGNEALDIKLAHGLRDQLYRSYNQLGLFAQRENRYSDASRLFERTIEFAEEVGNDFGAAAALGNLALVQTELGRFEEARAGFVAMRETMAQLDSTYYKANSINNLGMLEIRLGNPQAAIPVLQEALALYEAAGAPFEIQNALGQLGTAYTALGDPARAFSALDSAFTLAEAYGFQEDQAINLELMAEIYRSAGDFQRALDLYDSAKTINAELGLDFQTGIDLRGEADIHVRLGDLVRAREAAEEALQIHRRAGAPLEALFDELMLAEVLDRLDQPADVRVHLEAADKLADELNARIARIQVALSRARIADRHRRSGEVLEVIHRIQPDLARAGYSAEWTARLLESRALEREGAIEQAAVAGRRSLKTVERVRGNFGSGLLRTAFVANRGEVYAHLVSVLLRLGEVAEAFEVADGARGRVLLEQLATRPAKFDSPANTSQLSEGETLLRGIDVLVENIFLLEQKPPSERAEDYSAELNGLYDELERARREYEGLLIQTAETDPGAAAFARGTRTDVDAVQASLGPGQLLVEYFVPSEGNLVVFAVSRDGVHVLESPINPENLASRVRLVRDLIARPDGAHDRTQRVLAGLHEALIAPVIHAGILGEADELIIVPHQVLNYLPFAALRDGTTDRYLVQDFTVRVLPSAAALPVLHERSGDGGPDAAATVFAPFPDRLPGTRRETRAVTAGDRRTRRHLGSRATEQALRDALEGSGLVHVATHGIMNVRNPMFSRLELARNGADDPKDDGRLEVHELLDLSIRAPVVFLSGCETGVGGAYSTAFAPGEDYATLAQAFLYAGAANVIATLWPVEDNGAAAFADEFYQALGRGSPAAALAEAQRAMLSQKRYSAPYHWAPYQLAGDDEAPGIPHRSGRASV